MKLTFDPNIKVAGIGMVPWNRVGPELWLPQYKIASLYPWDLATSADVPEVIALNDHHPMPAHLKQNTRNLLNLFDFHQLLDRYLPGYALLPYRSVKIPAELSDRAFLMNDPKIAREFENKVIFRQKMATKLMLPAFTVYYRANLLPQKQMYEQLMAGRSKIVLQDEMLSGARGTFIIGSFAQYQKALKVLEQLSKHERVVVSDFITDARERSIQSVVTGQGIFTGPLQRQLISHPLLADADIPTGDKFCGAAIMVKDQDSPEHLAAVEVAKVVGKELQRAGYRGIFGIDFLLDAKGQLFVLEVNPRLTGVTPLLSALNRGNKGVPFYLLHLLELGNYPYQIVDNQIEPFGNGALLVLHSLEDRPLKLSQTLTSGTYMFQDGKLKRISDSFDLTTLQPAQFIIQAYMPKGVTIKPGDRLLTLMFSDEILDINTDKLYNTVDKTITAIRQKIVTQAN